MSKLNQQKGFTIIEVVLVLAIAGLIFLIVFLALPDLERARRNTQRKSDLGHIVSALQSYASNNAGAFPTAANFQAFLNQYEPNMADPSTNVQYVYTAATVAQLGNPAKFAHGDVDYFPGDVCTAGSPAGGDATQVAVVMALEPDGTFVCQSNQ
ncbi:MAG TPA: type II secretion system protein [Candidatus Saccharimonadales bacterium]|nr:type II secretion system protein [Candidatus Saccharimonadales bacterium]